MFGEKRGFRLAESRGSWGRGACCAFRYGSDGRKDQMRMRGRPDYEVLNLVLGSPTCSPSCQSYLIDGKCLPFRVESGHPLVCRHLAES